MHCPPLARKNVSVEEIERSMNTLLLVVQARSRCCSWADIFLGLFVGETPQLLASENRSFYDLWKTVPKVEGSGISRGSNRRPDVVYSVISTTPPPPLALSYPAIKTAIVSQAINAPD